MLLLGPGGRERVIINIMSDDTKNLDYQARVRGFALDFTLTTFYCLLLEFIVLVSYSLNIDFFPLLEM